MTASVSSQISFDPTPRFRYYAERVITAIRNSDASDLHQLDAQLFYSSPFECQLTDMLAMLVDRNLLTSSESLQASALTVADALAHDLQTEAVLQS